MIFAHAKYDLIIGENNVIKLVDVVLFHVDKCKIKCIILHQTTGADGTIFFKYNWNFWMFCLKCL